MPHIFYQHYNSQLNPPSRGNTSQKNSTKRRNPGACLGITDRMKTLTSRIARLSDTTIAVPHPSAINNYGPQAGAPTNRTSSASWRRRVEAKRWARQAGATPERRGVATLSELRVGHLIIFLLSNQMPELACRHSTEHVPDLQLGLPAKEANRRTHNATSQLSVVTDLCLSLTVTVTSSFGANMLDFT